MTKNIHKIIFTILILSLLVLTGCGEKDYYTIEADGSFTVEECTERGLNDKVIMLESKYCHACKEALPLFISACAETGVEPLILDLSINEHRTQMESYDLSIQYTPTYIFGCDYYVGGGKTKEEYIELINNMQNE